MTNRSDPEYMEVWAQKILVANPGLDIGRAREFAEFARETRDALVKDYGSVEAALEAPGVPWQNPYIMNDAHPMWHRDNNWGRFPKFLTVECLEGRWWDCLDERCQDYHHETSTYGTRGHIPLNAPAPGRSRVVWIGAAAPLVEGGFYHLHARYERGRVVWLLTRKGSRLCGTARCRRIKLEVVVTESTTTNA